MNNCGCGCGCKVQLIVEEECPIALQIIDGETVRMGCADFLIRTDKDYNHLENKPSINDVTLEGNKTLEELGIDLDAKLDKPPMTGQSNGFLKNNLNGGDPEWTIGMYAHEVVPNNGGAGFIELNLGNDTDYKTAPYGRYGVLRLIMTDGDKRGIVSLVPAPPLVSGEKKAYYFIESNQAQTSNYMLSSPNRDNTTGRLAKFGGGTSITESELTEEDINNKIDKPSLTGQNSGLLRNNINGEPSWTIGAYVDEQVSDGVRAGFVQLTLGNATDYRTPPYGRYGTLRLIMTDGDKRGIAIFGMAPPLVSGEKKAYYFLESNHAQTNNYMLSSANRDNTANKLAVFADGTSLSSGTLGEGDIEIVANKVTSLSAASTDTQYPSAKAVYDAISGVQPPAEVFFVDINQGTTPTSDATSTIAYSDIVAAYQAGKLVVGVFKRCVSNVLGHPEYEYISVLPIVNHDDVLFCGWTDLMSQFFLAPSSGGTEYDWEFSSARPVTSLNGQTGDVTLTVPTKTSDLTNDGADNTSVYVEADELATVATSGDYDDLENLPDIPTATSDLLNDGSDGTSTYLEADETAYRASGIPFGKCEGTSTATALTATVPGITELRDGVCMWLRNGAINSAANFTLNINSLGAKPVYSNMADATRESTLFNKGYTFFFVYDETRVAGGCWVLDRGYDSNTNTLGYQLRTNSSILQTADAMRYYKLLFTSADGTKWVPGSSSTANSATSAKTVNQRPIDPFGTIVYLANTTNYAANADVPAASIWQQYVFSLGYTFNRTGAALAMTTKRPVYVKCAPQADGSAVIDSDNPFVQALPSTADGKIYIFLGIAYSATNIELQMTHPVYYYKDGAIREWTGVAVPTKTSELTNDAGFLTLADLPVWDGGVE